MGQYYNSAVEGLGDTCVPVVIILIMQTWPVNSWEKCYQEEVKLT